jgi:hypothetical protein
MTLEDPAGAATEQEPAGSGSDHTDHLPGTIQEDDRDRHPHAQRVHGPAALQEKGIRRLDPISAEPPASAFPACHCSLDAQRPHGQAVHRWNVPPHTDTAAGSMR